MPDVAPVNTLTLPLSLAGLLNVEARRRGTTAERLALDVLKCVALDRLYDAVLDEDETP